MKTEIYWVPTAGPGRLAIMPRPRGDDWLEDEVRWWRANRIDIVVSLLTGSEIHDLGLSEEALLCEKTGLSHRSFPISDRGTPTSKSAFLTIVESLVSELGSGKNVAIHCRQGIGRAPLVAAAILLLMGFNLDVAIKTVAEARGCPVPETAEQQRWLADFAKEAPTAARG